MDRARVFETLNRTMLTGVQSEDYEQGFWDCYRQISENFERYFDKVEKYKPNKNVQPPPYQIVSEGYNPYAKFKELK